MKTIVSIFAFSSLTFANFLFLGTSAEAFDFALENQTGNDYTYTINLEANDSLDIGDQLILTNLSGVTAASASNPYSLDGFDTTSANFSVNTNTNGAATLTGVISLTSPDSLDNIDYQAFFNDNGTPSQANGTLNNTAAVPFEFSPGLGIMLILGSLGIRQLKRN